MKSFLLHTFITAIVWTPGLLAGIGAGRGWNSFLIFMLCIGQLGLIATLVALLAEVTSKRWTVSKHSNNK